MTINELNNLLDEYMECKNYLEGRVHSPTIAKIAKHGAELEVEMHRDSILQDLIKAGLHIEEE
jgi:hypothetical protein